MAKQIIEVTYNGKYPAACMGRLTISVNGKVIYDEEYCCHSTGSVTFDANWNEHVASGELVWDPDTAKKFRQDIQDAVKQRLSKVHVCCGGCV